MELIKYQFKEHGDARGELIAIESGKEIPFSIKRVYYIYGVGEGVRRGYHAHKKLEQVLICMHGSCKVLLDDGRERAEVLLDSPAQGLYVGHAVWREMFDFSPDAVLVVLASELYDESDYIREYPAFLRYVGQNQNQG